MKSILFLLLFIFNFGCGKFDSQQANQSLTNSQSGLASSYQYGHYSIPATQMVGGSPQIIASNGSVYYLDFDTTSTSIYNYLEKLPASAYSVTKYCVKYVGVTKSGRCPFNPTATCNNMTVQSILAVDESNCPK